MEKNLITYKHNGRVRRPETELVANWDGKRTSPSRKRDRDAMHTMVKLRTSGKVQIHRKSDGTLLTNIRSAHCQCGKFLTPRVFALGVCPQCDRVV